MRVAVIGAGVSGLAAARKLQTDGYAAVVFDAAPRAGGVIASTRHDGWLYEHGPNTLAADEKTLALLADFGARDALVEASAAAAKRYLVKAGAPVSLPAKPPSILKTPLFSFGAKLRLLREPFVKRRAADAPEESIADFVRRRLSAEWLERAVGPFVSGVYAGDPERLSLRHAFPRMFALEQNYGSLIKGAIKLGGTGGRKLVSTPSGLQGLVDALAAGLELRLGKPVTALDREGAGWRVAGERFDRVIVTLGPGETAQLAGALAPALAARLTKVRRPHVAVVHHGYRAADVAHPLDGFGMLIPRSEGCLSLGTLFLSAMFAGRAPSGHALLTTYVGGALHPEVAGMGDADIQSAVVAEHRKLLGITGPPVFSRTLRVPNAIVQYELGHGEVVDAVAAAERDLPGLFFRGGYYGGVALGDRLAVGTAAAADAAGGAA